MFLYYIYFKVGGCKAIRCRDIGGGSCVGIVGIDVG